MIGSGLRLVTRVARSTAARAPGFASRLVPAQSRVGPTAALARGFASGFQSPGKGAVQGSALLRSQASTPVNLGIVIVPQQTAYVVERFGRFHGVLEPGLHFLIPVVDVIAYVHSLKEEAVPIPNQTAITRDNVTIQIDGMLYLRIVDPQAASYGVSDAIYAVMQLAQTTMRSELGKITLDKTFEERESLNAAIVKSINEASNAWGVRCLRYEIRDIMPPSSVRAAMDLQAEAERRKRADILESEGRRQSEINRAEGAKQAAVLLAEGQAESTLLKARAVASSLSVVSASLRQKGAHDAVSLRVAEQYISAFSRLAERSNTILLPSNAGSASSMVAEALATFQAVRSTTTTHPGPVSEEDTSTESTGDETFGGSLDFMDAAIKPEDSKEAKEQKNAAEEFVPSPYPTKGDAERQR